MFDRDTMIISYDAQRGDPRGTRARSADTKALGLGDCIDCGLCVQVCPTGIDIRNGLQYDCIGCAACIDVCNGVMDKMRYPRGLIRYATQNGMDKRWTQRQMFARVLRPRVLIYGAVLLAIATALLVSLGVRSPFRVDVVRDRASLARIVADGRIENVYRLQVMNATESTQRYRVQALGLAGAHIADIDEVEVGPAQTRWFAVAVQLPYAAARDAKPGVHGIRFEIDRLATASGGDARVVEKSTFVIPR